VRDRDDAAAGRSFAVGDRTSVVRDRAVSDVLGFVLVFALVTATVGVVYTAGLAGLQDARTDERVENAERAFDVLASSVDDEIRRDAPSRATEVRLSDARLSYGDPVAFNVTFLGSGDNYSVSTRPVVYSAEGGRVVYEGGAVLRDNDDGERMVREPPMTFGDTAVVPILVARASGSEAVGGSRTVLVRTEMAKRQVFARRAAGPYTLRVNVTSPRAPAWQRYFEDEAGASCSLAGDTAVCEFQADSVIVPVYKMDVEFV